MPHAEQFTRGVRAWRNVWCWKKFRCRQVSASVSLRFTARSMAHRALKNTASGEVEMDVQPPRSLVKNAILHLPRVGQPQCNLKQFPFVHFAIVAPARPGRRLSN